MGSKKSRSRESIGSQSKPTPKLSERELERQEQTLAIRAAATFIEHSGPLPHPAVLERYNQIVPGGAERIFKWVEDQSSHRRHLEKIRVEGGLRNELLGQTLGFIIALLVITGGFLLIWNGKDIGDDIGGAAAVVAALAGLVGVFIYGKKEQKKEREQKLRSLLGRDED